MSFGVKEVWFFLYGKTAEFMVKLLSNLMKKLGLFHKY